MIPHYVFTARRRLSDYNIRPLEKEEVQSSKVLQPYTLDNREPDVIRIIGYVPKSSNEVVHPAKLCLRSRLVLLDSHPDPSKIRVVLENEPGMICSREHRD